MVQYLLKIMHIGCPTVEHAHSKNHVWSSTRKVCLLLHIVINASCA